MLETVERGKFYRNKKNDQKYCVMAIAKHSETLEDMVFYLAGYETENRKWVRPLELFKEKFEEID